MSNQFELIINAQETKEKRKKLLTMNFVNHNLDFLIKDVCNKFSTKKVFKEVVETLEDLEFIIPKKNKEAVIKSDIEKLLIWANEHNISKKVLPHSQEQLLSLEVLNVSNIPLQNIPKHIRVLKNLKKLYLANCQLLRLPLEIYSLQNLEILWVQSNHLTSISSEINNLENLQEFVAYDNNLQKFPSIKSLTKLSFVALHRNLLSAKTVDRLSKTLPKDIQLSLYDQKAQLPFIIEPLSPMTLKAAKNLRDKVFKDDIEEIEKNLLLASLDPIKYKKVYEENEVLSLSYWVAKDNISKQVIGLTGIYTEKNDDNCWLGWFCIEEDYRKKGFGKQLLEFSIQQAQKMEKKYLCVYTYNIKKYKKALSLYEKYEFKRYNNKGNVNTIILKKQLCYNI
jgi:GNAT superfamily N-acetyltransferase